MSSMAHKDTNGFQPGTTRSGREYQPNIERKRDDSESTLKKTEVILGEYPLLVQDSSEAIAVFLDEYDSHDQRITEAIKELKKQKAGSSSSEKDTQDRILSSAELTHVPLYKCIGDLLRRAWTLEYKKSEKHSTMFSEESVMREFLTERKRFTSSDVGIAYLNAIVMDDPFSNTSIINNRTADACFTDYVGRFLRAQERLDTTVIKKGEFEKAFIRGLRPSEVEVQVFERFKQLEAVELADVVHTTRELLRTEETRKRVLAAHGKKNTNRTAETTSNYMMTSQNTVFSKDSVPVCGRCQRPGHEFSACFATKDASGKKISGTPPAKPPARSRRSE